jgi:hypothetical protein
MSIHGSSHGVEMFPTRRVALVDGDRRAAEMLHMFFRLMELECSIVRPTPTSFPLCVDSIPTFSFSTSTSRIYAHRHRARTSRAADHPSHRSRPQLVPVDAQVMKKPDGAFEELLRLFELVLSGGSASAF